MKKLTGMDFMHMKDDELVQYVKNNARYFTVTKLTPGQFQRGKTNYTRFQTDTFDEAITKAEEIFKSERLRCIIYGVAEVASSKNFSLPVATFPETTPPGRRPILKIKP